MRDFTLNSYLNIIKALVGKNIPIFGVLKWIENNPSTGAIIRHDVDRRPENALEMAYEEKNIGVFTTYYFRAIGSSYNPKIISKIHDLGHEIGYHYEDYALFNGDSKNAISSFSKNLDAFRNIVPVKTVAMHGRPFSKYNSLDFWKYAKLEDFGLVGEAFMTVSYKDVYYFTDTGRSWGAVNSNLRDRPNEAKYPTKTIFDTKNLCNFIKSNENLKISISAHPERWDSKFLGWFMQQMKDSIINFLKSLIVKIRK